MVVRSKSVTQELLLQEIVSNNIIAGEPYLDMNTMLNLLHRHHLIDQVKPSEMTKFIEMFINYMGLIKEVEI